MKKSYLVIITLVFVAIIFIPKAVLAEIATTTDWIGLFSTDASKNCGLTDDAISCRAKTVNTDSWVYTNNCTKIAGAVPILANPNCKIIPSPMPTTGTYEYRMYAYNSGSSDALIARSTPIPAAVPTPSSVPVSNPCPVQATNARVQNGLISAPDNQANFGNSSGTCVIDDKAKFAPYEIPSYAELKSLYYTQKATRELPSASTGISSVAADKIYSYTASPDVSIGPYNYSALIGAATVFVEGNLNIAGNITGGNDDGLVFVVGGDVTIATSVTQIDAVIIAQGTIRTAINTDGSQCTTNSVPVGDSTKALTVNGSLVSLDPGSIIFCRKLDYDSSPAEIINNKPKYLVILRDLMSDTLQKWSEIQ